MSSDPNAYASPVAVDPSDTPASKYIVWFVLATLAGVFCGTVWNANLRFVIHHLLSNPIFGVSLYSIAAVIGIFVSLWGYDRRRPLKPRILNIGPRVLSGFVLGFAPYIVGRIIAGLAPGFGASLASLNSTFMSTVYVATGVILSLAIEPATRTVIRYFASPNE